MEKTNTITSAVFTAVSKQIRVAEVSTNLFGRSPKVVQALRLIGFDVTSWNEDCIGSNALPTIWQPKGVVEG
jgi:hypothetical protein